MLYCLLAYSFISVFGYLLFVWLLYTYNLQFADSSYTLVFTLHLQAKLLCKSDSKWLLVNLQNHEEFPSHMLNRDTWVDEVWACIDVYDGGVIYYGVYGVCVYKFIYLI